MPIWPATLPVSSLMDRFRETPPVTVLRTQMDSGPAKLRQRTTAGVGKLMLGYLLDATQTSILDNFYTGTLSGGSLAFDFVHPRTSASVSCRFKSPPEYAPTGNGYFRVQVEFEVLP